jgi:hypothetical protein
MYGLPDCLVTVLAVPPDSGVITVALLIDHGEH